MLFSAPKVLFFFLQKGCFFLLEMCFFFLGRVLFKVLFLPKSTTIPDCINIDKLVIFTAMN